MAAARQPVVLDGREKRMAAVDCKQKQSFDGREKRMAAVDFKQKQFDRIRW